MGFIIEFIATKDGSNTLYSKEYSQHYHNCNDGALYESLSKHIVPALEFIENKKEIDILDICFGLGYNTLATIYYIKKNNLDLRVNIYSPELDKKLLKSLGSFEYPSEFKELVTIVKTISQNEYYEDEQCKIEVYNGDARKYLKLLQEKNIKFDVVYQDPFSSDVNTLLWTVEYFDDIYKLVKDDGIVTTYSIATPARLSIYESGFYIYEIQSSLNRKSTIALKKRSDSYKYIDMELKKQRNKEAKAFRDLRD